MRTIFTIGESLLDIIFREGQPQTAKAGGAMLNTSVSLGRIGLPISFISEYGNDNIGNLIDSFLINNGVDTRLVSRFTDGNTALALAFLNEKNDASYTFYKNYPQNRLNIELPDFKGGDILLCGSFYAISTELRGKFIEIINHAKKSKCLIIYDPNFRKAHLHELEILKPMIIENIMNASIVRGSDEDFKNIFGSHNADEAWLAVKPFCGCMIYTTSRESVHVRTKSFSGSFPVKKIKPLSTIGAGDNFNAGVINSFYKQNISREMISELGQAEWNKVISTGVEFASNVCLSYDNYIDAAFASRYRSASSDQI